METLLKSRAMLDALLSNLTDSFFELSSPLRPSKKANLETPAKIKVPARAQATPIKDTKHNP